MEKKVSPSKYLIVGAGPIGLSTAKRLSLEGADVTVVSRRGGAEAGAEFKHLALDANDCSSLAKVAHGAKAIFNCAMPEYNRWPEEFPGLAASILTAAKSTGADLVTLSNIYGYGATGGEPISESAPLAPISVKGVVRARMWESALASGIRATEVRASDFLGRGVISYFTWMLLPDIVKGEVGCFPGDLDASHSWSFTGDVVTTLIAASRSSASWGRAWHVPSHDVSLRELAVLVARLLGLPAPALRRMSLNELAIESTDNSVMREVMEMAYLFAGPCLLDSSETQKTLGIAPSKLDAVVRDLAASVKT